MVKDLFSSRLNYVQHYGKITKHNNYYKFVAFPDVDCLIIEMTSESKWSLIDQTYELIKDQLKTV